MKASNHQYIYQLWERIPNIATIFFGIFVLSYVFSFMLLNNQCNSSNCKLMLPSLYFQNILLGLYYLIAVIYLFIRPYLPTELSLFLVSEPLFMKEIRNCISLFRSNRFRYTALEWLDSMLIFSLATTNFLVGLQYSAKTKSLNQHYWVNAICKSSGRIPDFYMALLFIPLSRNSFITKIFKVHPVESTYHHRNLSISFFISIVIHAGGCLWSTVTTNDLELVERNVDSSSNMWMKRIALVVLVVGGLMVRKCYRDRYTCLFNSLHLIFPFIFSIYSFLHTKILPVYLTPGLVLYSLDLIVKIRNYFTNHRVFQCSLEKCGWIRLEARGIQTSFALANGYFFDFTFKELDSRTSRSLSVAFQPTSDCLVFLIQPSDRISNRLLQQLKNKQPPQSSNIELETLLDNDHLLISGVIHGPFGNNFFDFNRINQLACIVTGAGLMSSTLMIQEFIIKCPHKPVFLFWAIKDITQVEVSLLNDLLSIKPNRLRIQLYNHQLPLSRRVQISHVRQRMNAKAIIDHEIIPSMKSSRDIVGIFTSGSSIAYDVEDACARYPERIILKKFLYER